jgi:carboxymethylenebutenolidase
MCDELTEIDNESFSNGGGALSRRDFSKLSAAAIMSLMFPTNALGQEVVEKSDVMVNMRDGVSDCYYVRPSSGKHPAVLMWPDIKGLRPAFRAMGKRLAMQGYSVLVVNPFYRDAKAPVVGEGASFSDPETRKFLIAMARKLTQNASMADARAYIEFLDAQDNVDTNRKVGTLGYCMGGPLIMRTAGAVPNRVGAAASFHGGGLVSDADDSPHLLIPSSSAHVLHAIAENDDEQGPDAKNVLAAAYKAAGVPAEIEVYEGTLHGWCPPDSQVYNKIQAEKAWSRLTALFKTALA